MLYTSMPLERIYSTRFGRNNETTPTNQKDNTPVYKDISLPHGHVRTRMDGDQYIVDSIQTTDISDYLNPDYTPGAVYKSDKI